MMEKNRKNAGFTLVEVLVAITIMALTGGILLSSFTVAIKLNARAEREYEACQQAQVVMEKLLCSDDVRKEIGNAINTKISAEVNYLNNLINNEKQISIDESSSGITALKNEYSGLKDVALSISKYNATNQTVLCKITVTQEDDTAEDYQLTGQREIYLVGIVGDDTP